MSLLRKDMGVLEKAIAIAACLHSGQTRKDGEPYILHLIRVMTQLRDRCLSVQAIAVLHDTMEDCGPRKCLALFKEYRIPFCVVSGVKVLTKHKAEDYKDYIKRIGASSHWCLRIKLADIQDNYSSLLLKVRDLDVVWAQRKAKDYLWAMEYLQNRLESMSNE